MRINRSSFITPAALALVLISVLCSCRTVEPEQEKVHVPTGYYATLEVLHEGRLYRFGPFVGYHFRPREPTDLTRLDFLCFNERNFYTRDLPAGALLFTGEARLTELPAADLKIPQGNGRIIPIFADSIPDQWLATRPDPQDEYRHFHSCHDDRGAVLIGYWLRHVGEKTFTYDMGGRVDKDSPLYHRVDPGVDSQFAAIVEFDHGQQAGDR
ncbi:MAG: hypothetical protein M8357_09795 [Desulfobulbaceae bacterium]|nr:hypothetical protein [Desulfobulbaceae bacterium]